MVYAEQKFIKNEYIRISYFIRHSIGYAKENTEAILKN